MKQTAPKVACSRFSVAGGGRKKRASKEKCTSHAPNYREPGTGYAQGNAVRNDSCDRDLVTGWYRFRGATGDRMLDKCVFPYRCGFYTPGWLNGTHPTVTEGVVTVIIIKILKTISG